MKFIILLLGLILATYAAPQDSSSHLEWENFKLRFSKTYKSVAEETHHFKNFLNHLAEIEVHNKRYEEGLETYTIGINQFSDLSFEEFSAIYLSEKNDISEIINDFEEHVTPEGFNAPAQMDWRTKNAVSPVKDQGPCGSCWAFSANGALESQHYLKHGNMVLLSEQNLVDCDKVSNGCGGGWMHNAYNYMLGSGGVDTQASYPYEARNGVCRFKAANIGASITGYKRVAQSEQALMEAVASVGPIAMTLHATGRMQGYVGGIFSDSTCSSNSANHALLAVGYGSQNGLDYWIIKNSWGSWGEHGYLRLVRGKNMCGVKNNPIYPIPK